VSAPATVEDDMVVMERERGRERPKFEFEFRRLTLDWFKWALALG